MENINSVNRDILEFLNIGGSGRYLILGHKEPDGDCVASQLALAHFLNRIGRETVLFSEGPFDRPEISDYKNYFKDTLDKITINKGDRAVVVDCSTVERIGKFKAVTEKCETLVIDHHSSGKKFGTLQYIDKKAPSVTYMIQLIIESMGYKPDKYESELLLFGLCTDTGFFRHVEAGGDEIMHAAAKLAESGASLKVAYWMMYGNRKLDARKMLGQTLIRAKSYAANRILITYQTIEDREKYPEAGRGSDELYRLLQMVKGVEVIAFVREESKDTCSVGLRSRERIDVGKLAAQYGGGGHRLASGFDMPGKIEDVKEEVLRVLLEAVNKELKM